MSELRFTSNSPEFQAMIDSLGRKLYRVAKEEFADIQETWVRRMKKQQFSGYYPGPTRGRKLRARTGHLRSSVGGRVTGNKLGSIRALLRVGSGSAGYARLQEYGGTVRPKTKQWLKIPLADALRSSTGTIKPKAILRGPKHETGYAGHRKSTRLFRSKRGNLVIVAGKGQVKSGKNKGRHKGLLLYVLKRSVKVEPRLGAEDKLHHLAVDRLPKMSDRLLRVLVETKGAV